MSCLIDYPKSVQHTNRKRLYAWAAGLLACLALFPSAIRAAPVTADGNTVVLEPFNSSSVGMVHGKLTFEPGKTGYGQAARFDASNFVKYYLGWPFTKAQGTVEFWAKPDVAGAQNIFEVNWYNADRPPAMGHVLHTGMVDQGSSYVSGWPNAGISGKTAFKIGQWNHYAASWGPKGTRIYLNGVLDASSPVNMNPYVGGYGYLNYWGGNRGDFNGWGSGFKGLIDELHVSNVQRSDAEIAAHGSTPPNYYVKSGRISVGRSPNRAVMTPNGAEVYVSNTGGNSVSVISTANDTVVKEIPVGGQPDALAVAPDGSRVYVGQHGGNVSVIDVATKTVITTVLAGSPVRDLALSPDGKRLYMAMEWGGLNMAYTDTGRVGTVLNTPCPESVVFTPDGLKAYVNYQCAPRPSLGAGHDPIFVFDATNNRYLSAITSANGRPIANVGSAMAISPDGKSIWANGSNACTVYYYNPGCPLQNAGIINVVNTADNTVVKSLGFADGAGLVSFSPDSQRAYVGGTKTKVFDTATFQQVATLPISSSGGIAFAATGRRLYIPLPSENAVQVVAGSDTPPFIPW